MRICRSETRFARMMLAVIMTIMVACGCSSMNHSYDLGMSFEGLKTYNWVASSTLAKQYSLVESNVKFIADRVLDKKGFKKSPEKPDFMISIDYDYEIGSYYQQYGSQLRMLTLNIYRAGNKELIWRGTKLGAISTDTASGDLGNAVEDILSKFPPQ